MGMLVLTRRVNEKLIIDGDIEVMVSRIQGDKVRLSIRAPDNVEILRQEIWDRIQDEQPMPAEAVCDGEDEE